MSNSKPYDIVLIPESKIADIAIKTSNDLKSLDTFFTLDNKNYFPHISLYMLQIKDIDMEKVFSLLEVLTKNIPKVVGESKLFGSHDNYIDIEYVKNNEMQIIQMKIIELLNPIRDGLRNKDKERLLTSKEEEKETILKYGYRSVEKYFQPHLTFTRFKNTQEDVLKLLPDINSFTGLFNNIGIYEMGDNGTCIHEIKRWKLQ